MHSIHGLPAALVAATLFVPACVGKSSLGDYDDDGTASSTDSAGDGTTAGDGGHTGGGSGAGEDPEACALEPVSGPCEAAFTHFYFDPEVGLCKPFLYGGCEGVVPFQTMADCEASCLACEAFAPPDAPDMVIEVVLQNERDEAIYVDPHQGGDPSCDAVYPFALATADTFEDFPEKELVRGCRNACSDTGSCEEPSCPAICAVNPLIRIEPGAHYTVEWTAVTYRETRLPSSCADCDGVEEPVLDCVQRESLEPGSMYTFTAAAGTTLSPDCPAQDCDCEPGPDGWCLIESYEGGTLVLDPTNASTLITWDQDPTVTIVFE